MNTMYYILIEHGHADFRLTLLRAKMWDLETRFLRSSHSRVTCLCVSPRDVISLKHVICYILSGVQVVEIDLKINKVTIIGYVERRKVLKAVRKTGKRAEFWQEAFNYHNNTLKYDSNIQNNCSSYDHEHNNNIRSSSYIQQHAFKRTYNYDKHGYSRYHHIEDEGYGATSHDQTSSIFSDENPNACSIM